MSIYIDIISYSKLSIVFVHSDVEETAAIQREAQVYAVPFAAVPYFVVNSRGPTMDILLFQEVIPKVQRGKLNLNIYLVGW
jgi:hypothetical protein